MTLLSFVRRAPLVLALLLLAFRSLADARTDANKALFDRTVERINFKTMESVYDAKFARRKLPASLNSRIARRDFKEFEGDAGFGKVFHNYNDEAEKYKNRFGPDHGPTTLTTFEKALRGILIDVNFEFFLARAVKSRDDRQAIVKRLEGIIKEAVVQYNASGEAPRTEPRPDDLSGAADDAPADTTPETAGGDAQVNALNQAAPENPDAAPAGAPAETAASGETASSPWGTLALVLALAAAGGVAYLLFVVVPSLRAQVASAAPVEPVAPAAPVVDDHLPATYAQEAQARSIALRFELLADELDETKARVHELEIRLAEALAAPDSEEVLTAPPTPAYTDTAADVAHVSAHGLMTDEEMAEEAEADDAQEAQDAEAAEVAHYTPRHAATLPADTYGEDDDEKNDDHEPKMPPAPRYDDPARG